LAKSAATTLRRDDTAHFDSSIKQRYNLGSALIEIMMVAP